MATCHVEGEGSHHVAGMSRCLWRSNDGDRVTAVCACVYWCVYMHMRDVPDIQPTHTRPHPQSRLWENAHGKKSFSILSLFSKSGLRKDSIGGGGGESRSGTALNENPICHLGDMWRSGDVGQMWWCNAWVNQMELAIKSKSKATHSQTHQTH